MSWGLQGWRVTITKIPFVIITPNFEYSIIYSVPKTNINSLVFHTSMYKSLTIVLIDFFYYKHHFCEILLLFLIPWFFFLIQILLYCKKSLHFFLLCNSTTATAFCKFSFVETSKSNSTTTWKTKSCIQFEVFWGDGLWTNEWGSGNICGGFESELPPCREKNWRLYFEPLNPPF